MEEREEMEEREKTEEEVYKGWRGVMTTGIIVAIISLILGSWVFLRTNRIISHIGSIESQIASAGLAKKLLAEGENAFADAVGEMVREIYVSPYQILEELVSQEKMVKTRADLVEALRADGYFIPGSPKPAEEVAEEVAEEKPTEPEAKPEEEKIEKPKSAFLETLRKRGR